MAPRKVGIYRLFSWNFRNSSMKQCLPRSTSNYLCNFWDLDPQDSVVLTLPETDQWNSLCFCCCNVCQWSDWSMERKIQNSILGAEEVREAFLVSVGAGDCHRSLQLDSTRNSTAASSEQSINHWNMCNGVLVKVQKKNRCSQHESYVRCNREQFSTHSTFFLEKRLSLISPKNR